MGTKRSSPVFEFRAESSLWLKANRELGLTTPLRLFLLPWLMSEKSEESFMSHILFNASHNFKHDTHCTFCACLHTQSENGDRLLTATSHGTLTF